MSIDEINLSIQNVSIQNNDDNFGEDYELRFSVNESECVNR